MAGTLFICGTPIGNLEDITLRQLNTLKSAHYIACEDTRHTLKLLNHFEISKKLISYHEHNYKEKGKELVKLLEEGNDIALVSDAGMPVISDPGGDIVKICAEKGIVVTTVPGATAFVSAYILSGFAKGGFVFGEFFPQDKKERKAAVDSLKKETKASIYYESPHRLSKTLNFLKEELGEHRKAAVVREITKIHEEVICKSIEEITRHFEQNEPRGEIVIVIEGISKDDLLKEERLQYENMSISQHMEIYISQNLSEKDAMKKVAKDRGISKRDVYSALLIKD